MRKGTTPTASTCCSMNTRTSAPRRPPPSARRSSTGSAISVRPAAMLAGLCCPVGGVAPAPVSTAHRRRAPCMSGFHSLCPRPALLRCAGGKELYFNDNANLNRLVVLHEVRRSGGHRSQPDLQGGRVPFVHVRVCIRRAPERLMRTPRRWGTRWASTTRRLFWSTTSRTATACPTTVSRRAAGRRAALCGLSVD